MDADVLLQAGHEGRMRNDGSGTTASHGASGTTRPEHEITPIVANAAAAALERHNVSVVRVPGVFPKKFSVKLGLALHFDGSGTPCASGASVGYPPGVPLGSNKPTADLWKEIYGRHWPFQWMKDNFTKNLSGYYGYRRMSTEVAEMLIEFGEISCPEQDAWLQPRLEWLGELVAHFAGRVIGVDIPEPAPLGVAEPPTQPPFEPWDEDLAVLRLEIAELRRDVAELRSGSIGAGPAAASLTTEELDHGD